MDRGLGLVAVGGDWLSGRGFHGAGISSECATVKLAPIAFVCLFWQLESELDNHGANTVMELMVAQLSHNGFCERPSDCALASVLGTRSSLCVHHMGMRSQSS